MNVFIRTLLFALPFGCAAMVGLAASTQPVEVHGVQAQNMDRTVNPGDDFNAYANGAWLKSALIPPDQSSWGAFTILREKAAKRTADLIESLALVTAKQDSDEQKIADFYASFMDEAAIEAQGITPLKADLERIDAISDSKSLARVLGQSLRADVDALNNTNFATDNLFGLWVAPGFADPSRNTAYLLQGGLGLPDRGYYLSDNAKMIAIRAAYLAHVARILALAGIGDADAKAAAIVAFETRLAQAHTSRAENEDVLKANSPWTRADFAQKAPGLDWDAYFDGASLSRQKDFIVWQASAVPAMAAAVGDTPLAVMKDYLTFHLLDHNSGSLPKAFADERFAFYGTILQGTPKQQERWKRAVTATNAALGMAVGRLYVARYFPPSAKATAQTMVRRIVAAFGRRIDALDWMSPATRARAKEKLKTLYVGIGYPDKWIDYSALKIVRGDAIGNKRRAELFEYQRNLAKLAKPVDPTEWCITPQTVNAVNLPLQNALNFPAAILDPPFFDAKAESAFNYGAIGSVIGHEISHSFDDQGSQFDASGRLANWWTPSDFAHFRASADRLVEQYSAYKPFPDLAVNGQQTLSENIADVAGLSAAFDAWIASPHGRKVRLEQGLSDVQRFFIAYAQTRQQATRDELLRQLVLTDGHAPSMYRAQTVRNIDAWYDAFGVKPGAALYLPPDQRIRVW